MAELSNVASSQPIGVLLAAGRGRRMNGGKQFHPVATESGEKPLVASAFDSIAAVCRSMIVVVGHRAEEVLAVLGDRDFESVVADADAPMFRSVQAGLRAAQSCDQEASALLQLGDHPQVARATLLLMMAIATDNPTKAVMPEYQGEGGHPVSLPPQLIRELLTTECPDGLRGFWNAFPEKCMRIAVNDPAVVRDIDILS